MKRGAVLILIGLALFFLAEGSNIVTSTYNTVWDESTPLARRQVLRFDGAGVTAADSGGQTVVTIAGAGPAGASVYSDVFASLPACTTGQYVFNVLSSPLVGFCDGASNLTWRAKGELLPSLLDFATLVNFTNDSAPTTWGTSGGVVTGSTVNDAATNLRLAGVNPPAEPYTITVFVQTFGAPGAGNSYAGLYMRNSTNGRIENLYYLSGNGGTGFIQATRWTSPTAFSAAILSRQSTSTNWILGLRCAVDAVNVTCEVSTDAGMSWSAFQNWLRADFITTIDDVGVVYANINTAATTTSLYYSLEVQ